MAMLRWLRRRTEPPNPVGWGRHTPEMDRPELRNYLDENLSYELKWLLRSATEWHSQYRMQLKIRGYEVQVFTMDSAFLLCTHVV